MKLFSERNNLINKIPLQKDSLEQGTRNLLWNEVSKLKNSGYQSNYVRFAQYIWCYYLKQTYDEIPDYDEICSNNSFIRKIFMEDKYFRVFDLLEILVQEYYNFTDLIKNCNIIFERENCAYRFVNKQITEIVSDIEIKEIEEASNSIFKNVDKHIQKALQHYSDRQNPDYRNSIKESISAVEALCRNITEESTLGRALKQLEKNGVVFNSELKKGLEKIYGYTNAEDGIRHALMDSDKISKSDAKFMLVMCSAFINYIKENMKQ